MRAPHERVATIVGTPVIVIAVSEATGDALSSEAEVFLGTEVPIVAAEVIVSGPAGLAYWGHATHTRHIEWGIAIGVTCAGDEASISLYGICTATLSITLITCTALTVGT